MPISVSYHRSLDEAVTALMTPLHRRFVSVASRWHLASMSHRIMTLISAWSRCGIMTSTSVWCLCSWRIGVGSAAHACMGTDVGSDDRVRTGALNPGLNLPHFAQVFCPHPSEAPPPMYASNMLQHVDTCSSACLSLECAQESAAGGWTVEDGGWRVVVVAPPPPERQAPTDPLYVGGW